MSRVTDGERTSSPLDTKNGYLEKGIRT
jgi:hypothetical protein